MISNILTGLAVLGIVGLVAIALVSLGMMFGQYLFWAGLAVAILIMANFIGDVMNNE